MTPAGRAPGTRSALVVAFLLAAGIAVAPLRGHCAPAHAANAQTFAATRVELIDGRTMRLGEMLAGGPVLLDFWATWCKPCVDALPAMQALHESAAKDGLTIVGVSVDGPRNFSKVRPFVARMGLTYPIALDRDGSLQREFQVTSVPTTVLLDRDGRVAHVQQGFRSGEEKALGAAVRRLLAAPAPGSGELPGESGGSLEGPR